MQHKLIMALGMAMLAVSADAPKPKLTDRQRIEQLERLNRMLAIQKTQGEIELRYAQLKDAANAAIAEYTEWTAKALKDAKAEGCTLAEDGMIVCPPISIPKK